MPQAIRRFLHWNSRLSARLDQAVRRWVARPCAEADFQHRVGQAIARPHCRILDVGGGKRPLIDLETKRRLQLHVTGLDISASELAKAPAGAYDAIVVGDVATADIPGQFDLIVSRHVLEHVVDTAAAVRNLGAALAPQGTMIHHVPCGRAAFAFINRLLGNYLSSRLLWAMYPERRSLAGFKAYYRHCTPGGMRGLCRRAGLQVDEAKAFYVSDYFRVLTPLYAVELLRQVTMQLLGAENFAETFTIIASQPSRSATPARQLSAA